MNLDKWLVQIRKCEALSEREMKNLCRYVLDILVEEPNVVRVNAPVTVCGDIHGQFCDLLELLRTGGEVPETSYIFMGDFVDRGFNSLETLTLLLLLKARWPANVTLLRGNHESRLVTTIYGFLDECLRKYGTSAVWRYCCEVFDCLPIAAIVDNKTLCVHGGLSPVVHSVDQILTISRKQEIPTEGAYCDLVWSDPSDDLDGWSLSPRGAGWVFGATATERFLHSNNLKLLARAHQLVQQGHRFHFEDKVVTVWSAPNYCYRCGNDAAVMTIKESDELSLEFKTFHETTPQYAPNAQTPVYFL